MPHNFSITTVDLHVNLAYDYLKKKHVLLEAPLHGICNDEHQQICSLFTLHFDQDFNLDRDLLPLKRLLRKDFLHRYDPKKPKQLDIFLFVAPVTAKGAELLDRISAAYDAIKGISTTLTSYDLTCLAHAELACRLNCTDQLFDGFDFDGPEHPSPPHAPSPTATLQTQEADHLLPPPSALDHSSILMVLRNGLGKLYLCCGTRT